MLEYGCILHNLWKYQQTKWFPLCHCFSVRPPLENFRLFVLPNCSINLIITKAIWEAKLGFILLIPALINFVLYLCVYQVHYFRQEGCNLMYFVAAFIYMSYISFPRPPVSCPFRKTRATAFLFQGLAGFCIPRVWSYQSY